MIRLVFAKLIANWGFWGFFFYQMAFEAVMYLWNKKPLKGYGSRMSESILAILCHIIKGEPVIKVLAMHLQSN